VAVAVKFRADHVGSLLRPPELLQARTDFAEGGIDRERLRAIEDESVLKALEVQREAGVDVFTEGEYRRTGWSTGVREAVEGLIPNPDPAWMSILGPWQGPSADLANSTVSGMRAMVAAGPLRQVKRVTGDEATFLKQHAPGPWKITMPGPLSVAGQLYKPGVTQQSREDLIADIAGMLQGEVEALHQDGAAYIQLDSLHYVERVADKLIRARMIETGEAPET